MQSGRAPGHATGQRFPPPLEPIAWFITCEAVANVVKHAASRAVAISAEQAGDRLRLVIEHDGRGGADPTGSGLFMPATLPMVTAYGALPQYVSSE